MKYPEWAPDTLVEEHKRRTEGGHSTRNFETLDPETSIADIKQKYGLDLTEAEIEDIRRRRYRQSMFGGLPEKDRTALLEKLITDPNMKGVWIALATRSMHEHDSLLFFRACQQAITGWRAAQKQTAAERRALYQEIHDTASRLQSLMYKASAFDFYSIADLVEDESLAEFLEDVRASPPNLGSPDNRYSLALLSFCDVIPSSSKVLQDIGKKAEQYRDESPIVKKPNSQNAHVHYFVRRLSDYCQRVYNQPLHEAVAISASVIFDLPNCDVDYVRKIVKKT